MPLLTLEVENGQNAHNSIDTQNGNIFWLRYIFGLPFRNEHGERIDESVIQKRDNVDPNGEQLNYFTNPEDSTTSELRVAVSGSIILTAINRLNSFKQTNANANVNFSQIVGEETIDNRALNYDSIIKAIELIWFNFKSNRIYEDMQNDRVNSILENQPNSHHYVNTAYDGYMQLYRGYIGQQNNPLCYIHPLLFPKTFQLAFAHNQVPKSSFETDIHEEFYNIIITQQNLLYVQNQNTTLYIYRCPINFIINEVRSIRDRLLGDGSLRAPPAL